MPEPKARWTHLTPDDRLKLFSTVPKGLPDIWLMHVDNTHFDLIVEKDSLLAKEGGICTEEEESNKTSETDKEETDI